MNAQILTTLLLFVLASSSGFCQEIALTFDDAPTPDSQISSGTERADRLLKTFREKGVKEVAFFVITGNINDEGRKRLERYASEGHLLANHTHRHQPISALGTETYIKEIHVADSILKQMRGFVPWFRYPFLDEGQTISARDSIRRAIKKHDLFNGYVTIDNYDWYLNNLYRNAVAEGKKVNMEELKSVYINHIWRSIVFYDSIARRVLKRSPKHVLLLHENDLAAEFVDDLIDHLKRNNWKIISPRDAYADPIASMVPDVLFNNQGRIAAIANEKGVKRKDLVQQSEDEIFLENLVREKQIFR